MRTLNTLCLCGSTRFLDDFHDTNTMLTRAGFSIITISMALPKGPDGSETETGLKEMLDLVHFNKILRSDGIVVIGDGYIGRSTAREIVWASMQGKPAFHQPIGLEDRWVKLVSEINDGLGDFDIVERATTTLGVPGLFL